MAKKKVVKKQKIKKKKWFEIALPSLLRGEIFSEGYSESAEKLVGRKITASLGDILRSGSKRHMSVKLIVDSVKTSTAHTKIKSIEVSAPYLLRKTRKNSKVSGRFIGLTSDKIKVDVRLSAISRGHVLTTGKKEMRSKLNDYIQKTVTGIKKDALIMDLISGKIQNGIKRELHKIYPMRSIELEKVIIL